MAGLDAGPKGRLVGSAEDVLGQKKEKRKEGKEQLLGLIWEPEIL
jgi:hypothetical protein